MARDEAAGRGGTRQRGGIPITITFTKTHRNREMAPEKRPQDPTFDERGWTFKLLEHGGEYPDAMPQAIRATDAPGRSCNLYYVPVREDGRVVDSLGINLPREVGG